NLMGAQYPELVEKADHIASVTEQEEQRFRRTIERGLSMLDEQFESMSQGNGRVLDGRTAFKLYDTYGFPLDLTQVICAERGYEVDTDTYDTALSEARERSEFKGVGSAIEEVYRQTLSRVPGRQVTFTGYDEEQSEGKLLAIIIDGRFVDSI